MKLKEIIDDNFSSPVIYTEIGPLIFIWGGGSYIDILVRDEFGDVSYTDRNINVWDYESDEATIPFTTEALIDRCISWINE